MLLNASFGKCHVVGKSSRPLPVSNGRLVLPTGEWVGEGLCNALLYLKREQTIGGGGVIAVILCLENVHLCPILFIIYHL